MITPATHRPGFHEYPPTAAEPDNAARLTSTVFAPSLSPYDFGCTCNRPDGIPRSSITPRSQAEYPPCPPRRPNTCRTVVVIGFVTCSTTSRVKWWLPQIPLLLVTVLAARPSGARTIEGVADTVSDLHQLWASRHSTGQRRRKPTWSPVTCSPTSRDRLLAFPGAGSPRFRPCA